MNNNVLPSKRRNSSIELLRIISMVMIMFYHFAIHGHFDFATASVSVTRLWLNFISMGGKIGVDLFVLISGYYLISDTKSLNFKKILKLWGQVFFYSVVIYVLTCAFGISQFSFTDLIKCIFPITFSQWWFASTYFVLYFLHPFINKFLCSISKKAYQSLLLLLIVFWSVIPTLTATKFESNSLLWFMLLYAISGYIKLYGLNPKIKNNQYVIIFAVVSILTYLSGIAITVAGVKFKSVASHFTYFYNQEKINVLIICVSLFMIFINLKMNYHKWINIIASASFGVYLIHDDNFLRTFIWKDLFNVSSFEGSAVVIPYSIAVIITLYAVCTAIDLIRQKVVEKPYLIIVDKLSQPVCNKVKKVTDCIKKIVF